MRFDLDGLPVHFPYAAIYPEQHAYMGELKRAPSTRAATRCSRCRRANRQETAALISLITSYAIANPSRPLRLIYCTRTVHEMEKTLAELRLLFSHLPPSASAPSSRSAPLLRKNSAKNLRVHPQASAAALRARFRRHRVPATHGLLGPREGRIGPGVHPAVRVLRDI
ncbi:hypothetical protein PR202_ga11236 [Eleusine coracana subsp. coracana]|uniref:Helicase ATP-binding domain-containing protein n=1 Tax=Eleusine coracana subsp. coracana TaxID=191504 RepID=A0AAV5C8Z0_ELECO|nr:hypothetical protein PR202_ga11236 [Eleusine coracana subsp. coracana]